MDRKYITSNCLGEKQKNWIRQDKFCTTEANVCILYINNKLITNIIFIINGRFLTYMYKNIHIWLSC